MTSATLNPKAESFITQHLDVWTQATEAKSTAGRGTRGKINLLGIQKLRELILEMAVRGLLVPQNPNDEPASELLKKIAAEKAQLIKQGKIKKTKPLPEISEDEKPFDLPKGWEWIRLGEIGNIFNGNSINERIKNEKYSNVAGFPFIATKDIGYGFERFDYENGINIPVDEPKFKIAHRGSVLVCAEGGSAGKKCGIAEQDICFGNKLFANELYSNIESKYILALYLSPSFFGRFSEVMTGIIGGISLANFLNLAVQIPPLEEQKRIVEKVDELMALCDQLESQTLDSMATHQTLVETLLGNLANPENTANFDQAWSILAQNFDVLFTTDKSIDTLKQTILQLAVMGKLVPQNPNDEPASELLKKIAKEKAQLIQQGKLKKSKPLPEITEDEKPFDSPDGWEWVRIVEIFNLENGDRGKNYPNKSLLVDAGVPFVNAGHLENGLVNQNEMTFITEERFNLLRSGKFTNGDILYCLRGSLGKCALVSGINVGAIASSLVILKSFIDIDQSYLMNYLGSDFASQQIKKYDNGTAQPNLSATDLGKFLVPLPPKEEQTRIVAKVNELMSLCDQLKTQLQTAQQTQTHLAQSIEYQIQTLKLN